MAPNIARNTLYLTIAMVGQKALAFAYFVVLARVMMPENTGIYFLSISISTIFAVIADFGITPMIIREVAKRPGDAAGLIRQAMALKLPLILTGASASILAAWLLQYDPLIITLVAIAALVLAADAMSLLFYGVLRGLHVLKYESVGMFTGQALSVSLGMLALWLAPELPLLVLALLAGSLFNAAFSTAQAVRRLGIGILKPSISWLRAKKLLRIVFPFALAAIFVKLYSYLDSVLISKFIDEQAVGIYAIAYKYTYAFQFLPLAFIAALYPGMSDLLVRNKERLKELFYESQWYMGLLAVPIVFGIWAIAPELVGLAGGGYERSIVVLQALVFVLLPIFLDFPIGSLLNAADRQATKTAIYGATMVVNVAANVALIPMLGVIGSAYAALASFTFLYATGLYFVPKILPNFSYGRLVRILLPILASGLVMAVATEYAKPIVGFIPAIPIAASVYAAALFLTGAVKRAHVGSVLRLLKR